MKKLAGQGGAFSPFMYGLILGVTIFSAVSLQHAKQQLVENQRKKNERARADAEDVANALDFSILSETKSSYQEEYTLGRAKQFASVTGKTAGDEDFEMKTQKSGRESYGRTSEKVAITASDDTFLKARLHRTEDEKELDKIAANSTTPVAVYDTSAARERQIRTSNARMESLAEQVYAYYAAHLKFPDEAAFGRLNAALGIRDAWGADFNYEVAADGQSATLAFITPWNYERTLKLNLKDGPESAK